MSWFDKNRTNVLKDYLKTEKEITLVDSENESQHILKVDQDLYKVIEIFQFYDLVYEVLDANPNIFLEIPDSVYYDTSGIDEVVWTALKEKAHRSSENKQQIVIDAIKNLIETYVSWDNLLEMVYDVYQDAEQFNNLKSWKQHIYKSRIYYIQKIV